MKRNAPELKLPGLTNYQQSQLLWIHAAIQRSDTYTPEFLKMIVQTDIHSPSEFGIIGTFSNRLEFARDFNCPLGSKMNSVQEVFRLINRFPKNMFYVECFFECTI